MHVLLALLKGRPCATPPGSTRSLLFCIVLRNGGLGVVHMVTQSDMSNEQSNLTPQQCGSLWHGLKRSCGAPKNHTQKLPVLIPQKTKAWKGQTENLRQAKDSHAKGTFSKETIEKGRAFDSSNVAECGAV